MNNIMRIKRVFSLVQCYSSCVQHITGKCGNVYVGTRIRCQYNPVLFQNVRLYSNEDNTVELQKTDASLPINDENIDWNIVTGGDPNLEKKLKVLFLEVEILRQEGCKVPSCVKIGQWKELVHMSTRSMRRRYFLFLWKNEMKRENLKQKKEKIKLIREEELIELREKEVQNQHIVYGLNRNTITMRVYDSTITHFQNCKLIEAMQFSQKIVVDCGYDHHMTTREASNCAKQIMFLFSENRVHPEPFNVYLCNINREGHTMKELEKYINTIYHDYFPLNVTEKSYLDLFPKEDIVYLTPHCREELRTYEHDAVYVIGAIVDKVNKEPLSLAKAKKEGLRMAKLPLDRYLSWGSGSGKSLTLNQMIRIMLDLRHTGDWVKALSYVPRRKILQVDYKKREEEDFLNKQLKFRQRTLAYGKVE